ncbi:MAG TPA: MFS transporter [Candidatus Limnocylindrales bacterium]
MIPILIRRPGAIALLAGVTLLLVGWGGLLVPSAIRSIEHDFRETDAGVGLFYLLYAFCYALGSLAGGVLTERLGRRTILTLAVFLFGAGTVGLATAPDWGLFLAAGIPAGLAGGSIDSQTNGLILDLYPAALGRELNRLHVFFSVGALSAPLAVGQLLEAGVAWQAVILGTGLAILPLAALVAIADVPHGRHAGAGVGGRKVGVAGPLLLLAFGIGCYVAAEIGVSNWVVRFLADAPLAVATGALSLFWGGLTLGRLVSTRIADRFDHARYAMSASTLAAVALVAAVVVPWLPLSVVLFGVVGFGMGPIYPMIMAVGGERFPGRSAAVSGVLGTSAVIGSVVYPPIMGFLSDTIGLGLAMIGAAVLSGACALLLLVTGRRRPIAEASIVG